MASKQGIILSDGRKITTFKELEGEFLKVSTDYEYVKSEFHFTDNALRHAKDEIIRLNNIADANKRIYEETERKLKAEIEYLKKNNTGLVEVLLKVVNKREDN